MLCYITHNRYIHRYVTPHGISMHTSVTCYSSICYVTSHITDMLHITQQIHLYVMLHITQLFIYMLCYTSHNRCIHRNFMCPNISKHVYLSSVLCCITHNRCIYMIRHMSEHNKHVYLSSVLCCITHTHRCIHTYLMSHHTDMTCVVTQHIYAYIQLSTHRICHEYTYEVATNSRLPKNIGLFCKRALQKRPIFSKSDLHFEGAYQS